MSKRGPRIKNRNSRGKGRSDSLTERQCSGGPTWTGSSSRNSRSAAKYSRGCSGQLQLNNEQRHTHLFRQTTGSKRVEIVNKMSDQKYKSQSPKSIASHPDYTPVKNKNPQRHAAQIAIHFPALFPATRERIYLFTGDLAVAFAFAAFEPTVAAATLAVASAAEDEEAESAIDELLVSSPVEESVAPVEAEAEAEEAALESVAAAPAAVAVESVPAAPVSVVPAAVELEAVVPVDVVLEAVELPESALPTATQEPKGPAAASFRHRTRHASPFGPPVQFTPLCPIYVSPCQSQISVRRYKEG